MAEKVVVDIEFKTNIAKAKKDLENIKDQTSEINENVKGLKEAGDTGNKGMKTLATGFKGVGLAMKAMGVGLIIAAFNLLKDAVMQNQTAIDAVAIVTKTLGGLFNQLSKVVVDLGRQMFNAFSQPQKTIDSVREKLIEFKDYIVDKFSGVGTILKGIFSFDLDMIKDGLEEVKGDYNDFKEDAINVYEDIKETAVKTFEAIKEATIGAISKATEIQKLKNEVILLEAEQQKINFQYLKEQELLRQTRDDIALTFAERIKANEELSTSLQNQLEVEEAILLKKLDLAQREASANETNIELQKAVIEAETELADLEERITGFRSEQLTNVNSLLQEQKDALTELSLVGKTERELELEELRISYEAKLELARKSGGDIEAVTKEFNDLTLSANNRFADEDLAISDALAKAKEDQRKSNIDNIQGAIKMAGDLFEEGSAMQKATGVASAVIDTWKSVNMALASSPPPLSYITAGISLATGLKSVKNILAVKTKKKVDTPDATGGGGLPSGAGGGTEALADLSNIPSITEQFNEQFGGQQQPIQAYVVEQQVTESQQINTMIQDKATL
tara:strand:- start:555 stop:2246 length:1692 start_codon:yes stop_codon:yes gene_type:complete